LQIDWNYQSEIEKGLNNRILPVSRAKMLGGCSSHNQCLFVRGSPADFQYWPENWSYDKVLQNFKNIETVVDDDLKNYNYRGDSGPLRVSHFHSKKNVLTSHFHKACVESGYTPIVDHNIPFEHDQICSYMQFNVGLGDNKNHRQDAYSAFLKTVENQPNVEIITQAQVSRILFKYDRQIPDITPTVSGVEYIKHGKKYIIQVREDVILCAGAIGSPQILQLSGIGDAKHLSSLNIPVIQDLPCVGQELQDHLITLVLHRMNAPLHTEHGNLVDVNMFVKDKRDNRYYLQMYNIMFPRAIPAFGVEGNMFGAESILLNPESRGYVKIKSNRYNDPPSIHFNFLDKKRDLEIIIEGIRRIRKIMAKLDHIVVEEIGPGKERQTDEEIAEYIKNTAFPIFHPSGTCRMTEKFDKEKSVVDSHCRVWGVNKLRVADASIMPRIVSGNTNACALMIGDKCADIIIEERSRRADIKSHL
jgi:choline dehydrogenase